MRIALASLSCVLALACSSPANRPRPSVTQPVGPAGGELSPPGGEVSLRVPAGALDREVQLTVTATGEAALDPEATTPLYEFGPDGTVFARPVLVTLPAPALADDEEAVVLWSRAGDPGSFEEVGGPVSGGTIIAAVSHFCKGHVKRRKRCQEGAACQPENACATGAVACEHGRPVCRESGALPDETSCGQGLVCTAGACAPGTRTVRGTFQTTYWVDDGTEVVSKTTVPAPPAAGALLYALVPSAGGYTRYDGTFDAATGAFSIPGVPGGTYFLTRGTASGFANLTQTDATWPDVNALRYGRPDAVRVTGPTPVTLSLTGLEGWQVGSDLLEIESSGTPAWVVLYGNEYGLGDLPAGATSVSSPFNYAAYGSTFGTLWLPDGSKGDALFVHQLSARMVTAHREGAGTRYATASRYARLTDVTIANLTGGAIAGELQPTPLSGWVHLDVHPSGCRALAADLPAGAQLDVVSAWVTARPYHAKSEPGETVGSADLLALDLPPDAPDTDFGPLRYGRFLDPIWSESVQGSCQYSVPLLAAGATVRKLGL